MNTVEYLDLVKQEKGLRSDNQLAVELGWSRAKISNYRAKKQHMDAEAARIFAEYAGLPVMQVVADMEAQRQKNPSSKKAWKMLAKLAKEKGTASPILLILISFFSWAGQYCILC